MVQLHFTEESIKIVLRNAKEELEPQYYTLLEELYMDLEADPRVTSLATIKPSLDKARVFLRWLQENKINPLSIDMHVIKKYLLYLKLERRAKQSTIAYHVRVLRRLMRLLGKEELANKIPYPRKTTSKLELPSPETIEKIIAETPDLKYKVITALLYETALRISELLALKGRDIVETPQGYYRIYIMEPKNNEPRVVYVIKYASLLREYLNLRKPGPEDYLFPSPVYKNKPINPRNVEKFLKRKSLQHRVKLHPHLLRHLRATLLIKEKIPERIVMKLLGHRSEKMMRIYINLVQRDVEETILQHYGIKIETNTTNNTTKCPRCGAENQEQANYCWRCGLPLNQLAAQQLDRQQQEIQQTIQQLLQILKQNPQIIKQLTKNLL